MLATLRPFIRGREGRFQFTPLSSANSSLNTPCTHRRKKAREFEALHKYKEAEKAYLQGEEVDTAIAMYKKARLYEHMIRLVQQYRKDNLAQVWESVAGCDGVSMMVQQCAHIHFASFSPCSTKPVCLCRFV